MSQRVECPSCGHGLRVSESVRGEWVTCPRCLAEVAVPTPTGGSEAVQAERSEQRDAVLSCPRCRRAVEAVWISCPWCEEPLRGRDSSSYGRPDLDVRRDRKSTSVVVIILAVLGCLGVAFMGSQAFAAFAGAQVFEPLYLIVALLFLAGLTTLIVFARSGGNPGADGFRRVIVGTLAMAGGLVIIGVLTVFAFFIYILIVCGHIFSKF